MQYDGLRFSFTDMLSEIQAMTKIGKDFLAGDTHSILLPKLYEDLQTLRGRPAGSKLDWEISRRSPLRTIAGRKYEAQGRKSHHLVYGEVCGKWEIENDIGAKPGLAKYFKLRNNGQASIKVRVVDCSSQLRHLEIARWNVDVGDAASPGCHFHTQICLEPCMWFPKSLSVPRLPALLHTPMDVLEFLISELFQNEWQRHVAATSREMQVWNVCQKKRLLSLLKWQHRTIANATGSPWTALKTTKPESTALLQES